MNSAEKTFRVNFFILSSHIHFKIDKVYVEMNIYLSKGISYEKNVLFCFDIYDSCGHVIR